MTILNKTIYYANRLIESYKNIMKKEKRKQFGWQICFLDFMIFLQHRSSSSFAKRLSYLKDKKVQEYLKINYKGIIDKYTDSDKYDYPLVSIIIPFYNNEDIMDACVSRIQKQSYQNIEIIMVNDGYTDNSLEIVEQYAKTDDRIIIINKENGGQSSARNSGLDICHGDYIIFLDSDDYYYNNAVEKYVSIISNYRTDMVCSNIDKVFLNGKKKQAFQKPKEGKYNNYDAMKLFLQNIGTSSNVHARLYKKELFENIRFPNGRLFEDAATSYKFFIKAENIYYLPESLYVYSEREGSTMKRQDEKIRRDELYAGIKRYQGIKKIYDFKISGMAFAELVYDYVHVYECYMKYDYDRKNIQKQYEYIKNEQSNKHYFFYRYLSIRKCAESYLLLFHKNFFDTVMNVITHKKKI